MTIRWPFLALLFLLIPLSRANSAKVKVWHQHTHSHYEKAKFHQAVVTSEGALRLSRQVKPLAGLEAANVWDLAEDKQGNLYAGTGDEGKLYKITPDGKASVVLSSKESHIFCLAATPEGTIFAGAGPTGKILRITPDGKVQTVADKLDSYVWSLAYDPGSQTLYAGTGPKGKIYKITADGKMSVFYATKQEHILCLALGEQGDPLCRNRQARVDLPHRSQRQGIRPVPGESARSASLAGHPRCGVCRHQRASRPQGERLHRPQDR